MIGTWSFSGAKVLSERKTAASKSKINGAIILSGVKPHIATRN